MNHLHIPNFKSVFILAFATSCLLYSCSINRILKVNSPSSDCAASGQDFCYDTTITASMWKGRTGTADITSKCTNGISRVKLTTKPLDVLLGFITIGFVVKQRLQWDCSQRSGSSDLP